MSTDVLQKPEKEPKLLTSPEIEGILAEHASETAKIPSDKYKQNLAELSEIGSQEDFNKFANSDLANELKGVLPTPEVTPTEETLGNVAVEDTTKVDSAA